MPETKILSKNLIKKVRETIEKSKTRVSWDYSSKLSREHISKIFDGKVNDVYDEIWDQNIEHISDLEHDERKSVILSFAKEIADELGIDSDEDSLAEADVFTNDWFSDCYPEVDINYEQLFGNSGPVNIRIKMYSNYDCINSWYWETESEGGYKHIGYFKAMLDQLNLNPRRVKRMFKKKGIKTQGQFPNKRCRNGKEYVGYENFAEEVANTSAGGLLLTFMARADLNKLVNKNKITEVIMKKNSEFGLYSCDFGGGGLMELELLRDKKIDLVKPYGKTEFDYYSMVYDEDDGYSLKDCFGVTDDFFGNTIEIKYEVIEEIKKVEVV
jgi:hypothetical protein